MKKFFFKTIGISAFVLTTGYNVYTSQEKVDMSDMAIANVEALAHNETGDEFTNATDCVACWENYTCRGKDGKLYSYSIPKANS